MAVTGNRIEALLYELRLSKASFAKILGVNHKTITSYIEEQTQPNDTFMRRIYVCLPDLSKTWFETGTGNIWKGGKKAESVRIVPVSTGVKKIVCSATPPKESPDVEASETVVTTPVLVNGDVVCPYYDVDFACGFPMFENDQTENPSRFIVSPVNRKDVTVWCNATGRSMEPTIMSGDAVALEKVDEPTKVVYGEIYAIVTNSYRTIKRICQGSSKDTWRLVSDNKEPIYADQEIELKDVLHVYRVTGSMHKF